MPRTSEILADHPCRITVENARQALQKAVGDRIRSAREQAGVGQRECARLAGVNISSMFRIERGQQNISLELLARISLALGVEMEEMLIGIRPDPGLLAANPED